jgi:diacylglycerol kinase family enzyme
MRVGNRFFVQQIGVGIDALAIRDTSRQHKRSFGTMAYLWSGAQTIAGFQPQHFTIIADGQYIRKHASQVLIANGSLMGTKFLRWGPNIHLDDKRVMVCIVSARTGWDYLKIAWYFVRHQHRHSRGLHYIHAKRFVSVEADHSLPVQADGEIIRQTPVRVQIIPHAVCMIVPVSPS